MDGEFSYYEVYENSDAFVEISCVIADSGDKTRALKNPMCKVSSCYDIAHDLFFFVGFSNS